MNLVSTFYSLNSSHKVTVSCVINSNILFIVFMLIIQEDNTKLDYLLLNSSIGHTFNMDFGLVFLICIWKYDIARSLKYILKICEIFEQKSGICFTALSVIWSHNTCSVKANIILLGDVDMHYAYKDR